MCKRHRKGRRREEICKVRMYIPKILLTTLLRCATLKDKIYILNLEVKDIIRERKRQGYWRAERL